jgi:MoeA C-terminal region (domain IV)
VAILPTGDELRPAGASLAHGELADTNSPRDATLAHPPRRRRSARGHTPDVLRRCGRILVRGVAMRPGHAVVLGVDELALPLLASLEGAAVGRRHAADPRLAANVASRRGSHHRLRVRLGTVDGRRVAVPLRGGASVLTSLVHADALISISAEHDALPPARRSRPSSCAPHISTAHCCSPAPPTAPSISSRSPSPSPTRMGAARVAFCEMAPEEAVAFVRDRLCHAAAVAVSAGAPVIDGGGGRLVAVAPCRMRGRPRPRGRRRGASPCGAERPAAPGVRVVVGAR